MRYVLWYRIFIFTIGNSYMRFNEDSRVKLRAILHLTQLGYTYISLKDAVWDLDTKLVEKHL